MKQLSRMLVKASAQELLKKLEDQEPEAKTIAPSLTSYYDYILGEAKDIVSEIISTRKLSELTQIYMELIEKIIIPTYIIVAIAHNLSSKITDLTDYTKSLAFKLSSMISNEENKIAELEKLAEKLSGTPNIIEDSIAANTAKINNIEQKLANMKKNIDILSKGTSSLQEEPSKIKNNINDQSVLGLVVLTLVIAIIAIIVSLYAMIKKH